MLRMSPDPHYLFLRNFDADGRILKHAPERGPVEEIAWTDLPAGVSEDRGLYVRVGSNFVGAHASPEGPVCFFNDRTFPAADANFGVEVVPGNTTNEFRILWGGEVQASIHYEPTPYRGYDNWSMKDEDVDFFIWLKVSVGSPDFRTYFTLNRTATEN